MKHAPLVGRLSGLFLIFISGALGVHVFAGCCESCPPAQTVIIACDHDGGPIYDGDAEIVDEPFEHDQSAEALALSSPYARACKQMSVLKCPEAKKPAAGRTCIETLKAIAKISSFNPECVANAKTVEAARKCQYLKCGQ